MYFLVILVEQNLQNLPKAVFVSHEARLKPENREWEAVSLHSIPRSNK